MKMKFTPLPVIHEHPVTQSAAPAFLYLIQHGALLGLREAGYLNEMQLRQAEDALQQQYPSCRLE